MKYARIFIGAFLAGLSIGLGGLAFLSVDNKVIGALFFTIGLFTVCTFDLNLFTGKICYVFDNGWDYAVNLPVIWAGNLVGTSFAALFATLTRNSADLSEKAYSLCTIKAKDSLLSLFFLGVLCNIFIYIAVEGFKNNPHGVGKYLSLIFGVTVFILTGTEHCVADMFYFQIAHAWNGRAIACILVITLGNCVGGVLFPLLRKLYLKKDD